MKLTRRGHVVIFVLGLTGMMLIGFVPPAWWAK